MPSSPTVLAVGPSRGDEGIRTRLDADDGLSVRTATTGDDIWHILGEESIQCLVFQPVATGADWNISFVKEIHDRYPLLPLLVYTPTTDGTIAIEASRYGATEYVSGEHLDATDETLGDRLDTICHRDDVATTHHRATVRHLEAIVDHPSSFAGVLDPDGTLRFANTTALKFVDAEASAVEGRLFWDTPWWNHSEDLQHSLREAIGRVATGETATIQADHHSPSGEQRTVELGLEPIHDSDGTVVAIAAKGQDVTDREQVTTELRKNQTALEQLYRIISSPDDSFEEKLQKLLEIGCNRLDLAIGFLSTIDIGGEHFEVVEARGPHEDIQSGTTSSLSETYCRRAIEGTELLGVQDAEADGWESDPAYERFDLGCYLGGKVLVDGDLYGTLCFADREARDVEFSAAERTFVELLTEWVSYELERREFQLELEATQQQLENTLERIDDAFFSVDANGNFTYINNQAEQLLERSGEEILGNNIWNEFEEATDLPFFDEYQQAMENQEPVTFEANYEPLDVWFEVNAYPSEDGLSVFFRDVTERRERERILTSLLETSRDLIQASSREEIADIVVEATDEILDEEMTLVRLYDDTEDALVPVAATDVTTEEMKDRPLYEPGEGPVGRVFETGEPTIAPDLAEIDDERDRSPAESGLYLPIGEYGTLSIGAVNKNAFDTTDQRYAELLATTTAAALGRTEREWDLRKYQAVLETVQEKLYVLDEDAHFTLVSTPLAEWLGYTPEELVGRHVSVVLTDEGVANGRQRLDELQSNPDAGSQAYEAEGITATGDRVPVEIELSLFPEDSEFTGSVGAVRDLSALRAAQETAIEERDRFAYLFENLPDPIEELEFTDENPTFRDANPAFERVFDVDRADYVDKSRAAVFESDEDQAWTKTPQEDAAAGEPTEVTVNTPTGRRQFLFRGIRYQTVGAKRGFGIYTDITGLKRRERHLQVLHRILRHNLRNDLNVVHGFADQLVVELEDAQAQEYATRIRATADGLIGLSDTAQEIEQLINREATTEPLDPGPILTKLVNEYREESPSADIETVELHETAVYADRRLRTALDHLLENALEYAGDSPHVRLSIVDENDDGWVTISISDNGTGIPEQEWNVIVGEREVTQLEHGTGLGLWLVKWLVDAYGGELDYTESDIGGSKVMIRLRKAPTETTDMDVSSTE